MRLARLARLVNPIPAPAECELIHIGNGLAMEYASCQGFFDSEVQEAK